jgi:TPR repeat protein
MPAAEIPAAEASNARAVPQEASPEEAALRNSPPRSAATREEAAAVPSPAQWPRRQVPAAEPDRREPLQQQAPESDALGPELNARAAPGPQEASEARTALPSLEARIATQIGDLVSRGERMVAAGDIASARLYFQAAARKGSRQGAAALARSYDPAFVPRGDNGVSSNRKIAIHWYGVAARLGDTEAGARRRALMAQAERR